MGEPIDDLHLNELWVTSVKKIKAVRVKLKPTGITRIVGTNKAGKTSLLDSINYLIGGAETHPNEVIRRGDDSAEVIGDLGTVIVTRDWKKERGTKLTIKPKDGTQIVGGAQAWLDQRRGKLCFNPGDFLRLDKKKQVEIYKQLVGADTVALEADYKIAFELRTKVTATGKEMAAQYKAMPEAAADLPEEPVIVSALLDQQAKLQAEKAENERIRSQLAIAEESLRTADVAIGSIDERVARIERELAAAETDLVAAHAKKKEVVAIFDQARVLVAELKDPDLTVVYKQIAGAEAINHAILARKARAKLFGELELKRAESVALSDKLEALLTAKEKLLKNARVPVPGLGFNSDGLTLNGFPIEEASEAERTAAVVAIGLAQNPHLRFVTLKNGNDIDDAGMAALAALAEASNAQLIIERMAHDDAECTILIQDEDTVLIRDGEASGKRAADPEQPREAVVNIEVPKPMTAAEADIGTPPRLSLVPTPQKTPPKPPDPNKVPTFKKRPITSLSGEELTAAIAEVNGAIDAAPLSPKATLNRAKLEELKEELARRLDGPLDDGPEPGADG